MKLHKKLRFVFYAIFFFNMKIKKQKKIDKSQNSAEETSVPSMIDLKIEIYRYFKNLDGLRFFAAFAVIIGHCQSLIVKNGNGIISNNEYPYQFWANKLAIFGVDFFFVLSGFLISFKLFQEIEKKGRIEIKKFYVRRFLRLMPLYLLYGILAIVFGRYLLNWLEIDLDVPYTWNEMGTNLFFLFTYSTNIQTILGANVPVTSILLAHFWSLCVEEQFYFIWAPAMNFLKKSKFLLVILAIILGLFFHQYSDGLEKYLNLHFFEHNFTFNRFFHFGLGALLAWFLLYSKVNEFWIMFKKMNEETGAEKKIIYIIVGIQVILLFFKFKYLFGTDFTRPALFENAVTSVLIIWSAIFSISVFDLFFLESKPLKYLGKISYGIYIFHFPFVYITYKMTKMLGFQEFSHSFYWIYPILATVFSIVMAAISYEFFEKRILAMKERFR
jgi:peptidoglycan/LPS O-acetylase OafA/YrhL